MKLLPFTKGAEIVGYSFYCPGCKHHHAFYVAGRLVWQFNGDMERPTFSPSLVNNKDDPKTRCHLFLRDGQLQFLGDCWHDLKNQTVPLPDDP